MPNKNKKGKKFSLTENLCIFDFNFFPEYPGATKSPLAFFHSIFLPYFPTPPQNLSGQSSPVDGIENKSLTAFGALKFYACLLAMHWCC